MSSSPQKQLSELTIGDYRDAFKTFDLDEDGYLSLKEVSDLLMSLGMPVSEDELREMTNEVDIEGNGTVDFKEFIQLMARKLRDMDNEEEYIEAFKIFDKNSDIENGIENGKYNKTKSFVTVKRVAKSYQYSVRLIEQLSNGKLYGISNASESSLNSETKKNFLGEIKEDYIVDFSSAKSLDDAKNALASDNVGGCTKDILTGFYN